MVQKFTTAGSLLPEFPTSRDAGARGTEAGTATPATLLSLLTIDDSAREAVDASTPGYCYLCLFRPEHRSAVQTALGFNPWWPAVQALMLRNTGLLATGRFHVRSSAILTTPGDHFTQWHVQSSTDGILIREVLSLGLPHARMGADVQRDLPEGHATMHPSTLHVAAASPPPTLSLPFAILLTGGQTATVSIENVASWQQILAPYESAELVGFSYQASITGDDSSILRFAATTQQRLGPHRTAWLGALYSSRFSGSTESAASAAFSLPSNHPFGRELKALNLGTAHPRFHFHFAGTTGDCEITGALVVNPRGSAPIPVAGIATTTLTLA